MYPKSERFWLRKGKFNFIVTHKLRKINIANFFSKKIHCIRKYEVSVAKRKHKLHSNQQTEKDYSLNFLGNKYTVSEK
jgi:hypothetical protein